MSRYQQDLFGEVQPMNGVVYLASGVQLNWLGDVVLYISEENQNWLVPVEEYKVWHSGSALDLIPYNARLLVDAVSMGCSWRVVERVNHGAPF